MTPLHPSRVMDLTSCTVSELEQKLARLRIDGLGDAVVCTLTRGGYPYPVGRLEVTTDASPPTDNIVVLR